MLPYDEANAIVKHKPVSAQKLIQILKLIHNVLKNFVLNLYIHI